jgi:hypothetical protein
MVLYLESLIRKYSDQWNWLTVRLSKHQPDQKPDSNIIESFDLGMVVKEKKDGAGEEGRTPDLMLGKHTL